MKQASIYLDYAAATPVDSSVITSIQPYLADKFYNPSAQYLRAKAVRSEIEEARRQIAQVIGSRPSEIIFTSGGTEANNLAISGILNKNPNSSLIISAVEHESVREVAQRYDFAELPVDKTGRVNPEDLKKLITDNTSLVSVMYANNEIGTLQPIRELSAVIADVRKQRLREGKELPIYLHIDACQASNYLDIHVSRLGVDMMTLNGGKIYGPKQSGVLYVRAGIEISPLIFGGGQENGLRSGTENVSGIIGFAKAITKADKVRSKEVTRLKKLQKLFIELLNKKLPEVEVNGSQKHRLPNNIHISLPGFDNERLMMELDEQGIMCATGSACSASKDEPSHVLKSIGLSDDQAQSSLRFSMGRGTTEAEIRATIDVLQKIVRK